MINKDSAKRIKELRMRKGFSQERLADISGLSLRTIQRIENGETTPRGDSLRRLSEALEVSNDELMDKELVEENNLLILLNLSQFGFMVFPLLGIILPFSIWILKKDKVRNVNEVGKAILNFQISWIIALCFIFIGTIRFHFGIIGFMGLFFANFLVIVINTIKCLKRMSVKYNPAFTFLR